MEWKDGTWRYPYRIRVPYRGGAREFQWTGMGYKELP